MKAQFTVSEIMTALKLTNDHKRCVTMLRDAGAHDLDYSPKADLGELIPRAVVENLKARRSGTRQALYLAELLET